MKTITLKDQGQFKAKETLTQILSLNSERGQMNVDAMRKRIRVLDKLDLLGPDIVLEDEEYNLLKGLIVGFNFSIAHKDLLAVLDGVLEAKDG